MPFIQYDHKPLFYTLRRSARAKRLHIIAKSAVFEVVAPLRLSNHVIIKFVSQQRSWMSKQFVRQQKTLIEPSIWPAQFMAEYPIPFRGSQLLLRIRYGASAPVLQQGNRLTVSLPGTVSCHEVEAAIKKQLLAWYQQQAMKLISESIERFCPVLGRWPKGVYLKQQKSRWGSCGITQKIYLNWLLVLAPPGVLEYVVAHELGHLFYRNHGPRFWAKVAECMADFKEQDRWLNHSGTRIKLPAHW
ncbi:MAG: M48 family metallopeptidase [Candidatus Berkiella sp.]